MKTNTTAFSTVVSVVLVFFLILILLVSAPRGISTVLMQNWVCDSILLGLSILLLVALFASNTCDLLAPPFFFGFLYIILFFATPLYDIAKGNISLFGVTDLFDYGVKGSLMAFFGFVLFCLSYRLKVSPPQEVKEIQRLNTEATKQVEHLAITIWVVLFIIGMVCTILTTGFSISYILSFGIYGKSNMYETGNTLLGFIVQFTRGLVPLSLIICALSSKRFLVFLVLLLTAFFEVISGFRYMIVIMICGFFYYFFASKNKKIHVHHILLLALSLAFIVGIVGYSRNSVRGGQGFDATGFDKEDITDAILFNFQIYKSYYGVIKAVPEMTDYLYFDQMFKYTAIMIVPRAIWPEKPLNPGTKAQLYGLGEDAVIGGFAYPNLGEYYYSFGFGGILFFMIVFGWWVAFISNKYRYRARNVIDISLYSIAVPMTMQLLIRGYTPSNFYMIIALFFPIWIINSRIKHLNNPYVI